jgi:hypothetical protein
MQLDCNTWYPCLQPAKHNFALNSITTNEHEPGAKGAEAGGGFKANSAGCARDYASFAPHVS